MRFRCGLEWGGVLYRKRTHLKEKSQFYRDRIFAVSSSHRTSSDRDRARLSKRQTKNHFRLSPVEPVIFRISDADLVLCLPLFLIIRRMGHFRWGECELCRNWGACMEYVAGDVRLNLHDSTADSLCFLFISLVRTKIIYRYQRSANRNSHILSLSLFLESLLCNFLTASSVEFDYFFYWNRAAEIIVGAFRISLDIRTLRMERNSQFCTV